MKKLLFIIAVLISTQSFGQVFIQPSAVVALNPGGLGINIDGGYKFKSNFQVTAGFICDAVNDRALGTVQIGYHHNHFTFHGGIGLVKWSPDNKAGHSTAIFGVEYNWKTCYIVDKNGKVHDKDRWYCGVDFSQEYIYLKVGIKINYPNNR